MRLSRDENASPRVSQEVPCLQCLMDFFNQSAIVFILHCILDDYIAYGHRKEMPKRKFAAKTVSPLLPPPPPPVPCPSSASEAEEHVPFLKPVLPPKRSRPLPAPPPPPKKVWFKDDLSSITGTSERSSSGCGMISPFPKTNPFCTLPRSRAQQFNPYSAENRFAY